MFQVFGLSFSLCAFWLLMSGHYGPLLLSLGIISVLLVLYLTRRMDSFDQDSFEFKIQKGYFPYWSWLAKEIFKANIDVAKVVLSPKMKLSPRLLRVPATQKSELGVVVFANSITLTPGTVSVDIEGDDIIVHALNQELADGLSMGDMDARVTKLDLD